MAEIINKEKHTDLLAENLEVLRIKLHLTQANIAAIIGVSRQTYMGIENKRQKITWNVFMSLLFLFRENDATRQLLDVFGIYSDELQKYIRTSNV